MHLFRSLHSVYVDNYLVRRLVAAPVGALPLLPTPPHLMATGSAKEPRARLEVERSGSMSSSHDATDANVAAMERLSVLRARCNLRGGVARAPLTAAHDLLVAQTVLRRFSAVSSSTSSIDMLQSTVSSPPSIKRAN